jgi:protein-tyrosine phosphatase
MRPDLYWIPGPWRGNLAVVTRPRGGDWLSDETTAWKRAGIDMVVSLLEREEAAQLGLQLEGDLAAASGVRFLSLPIPDRGLPASLAHFQSAVHEITGELHTGRTVAVHCRQGIGRSGLIAIAALIAAGIDAGKAIEIASTARGLPVPETEEQRRWVHNLAAAEATLHT